MIVALLKLHADTLKKRAVLFLGVLPQKTHCSAVGLFGAEHTFDCSGFSGTICAEQTEYRTAFDRQVQMIDHRFAVIGFGQSLNKNRFAHFSTLFTARSSI